MASCKPHVGDFIKQDSLYSLRAQSGPFSEPVGPFAKEGAETGSFGIRGSIGGDKAPGVLPDVPQVGWAYVVEKAGTYAGLECTPGDVVFCSSVRPVTWKILQSDADDIVNVKNFGAKGDGVADDAAAFAAASAVGGKIFCPAGTYLLSAEPLWASGKSIQLFTLTDGVNFTGTYGSTVGISSAISGLQMAVVRSIGANEKALNIQQNLTDTAEYTTVVETAINTRINVGAGHTKTAWGIIGSVRSKSTIQTNKIVGGYFQGWRQSDGAANSVWGAVAEARDTCDTGSSGAIAGIEIDCVANGSCAEHYYNWVGAIVVGMSHNYESDENNVLGSGVRVTVNKDDNNVPQTRWHYGLELANAFDYGIFIQSNSIFHNHVIDLSRANFAEDVEPVGICLGAGQKIVFASTSSAPRLYKPETGLALAIDINGNRAYAFEETRMTCPSVYIYGAYTLTGESSLGTSSATLAANKPGSTDATAPTTWIKVVRGDQTLWVPAFAD